MHFQVPFEIAVKSVLEQLKTIAEGDYITPSTEKRQLGAIVYAGVSLPVIGVHHLLNNVSPVTFNYYCFLLKQDK